MSLKRLKVKTSPARKSKDEIPVVAVSGDVVKQYNLADAQAKAAEAVQKDLRPEIIELGTDELFRLNTADPHNPITTVKLQDDENEVLRVQFTSRYKSANPEAVDEMFESLRTANGKSADINNYVQETVAAKFNSDVFNDAKGRFSQAKFDRYYVVLTKLARELGDECPLSTTSAVLPLDSFHKDRWSVFPTSDAQRKISEVLPNTIQIVPVTAKVDV